MKVFISWSGDKSRRIAEAFRKWLPSALQSVKPYFSPSDIEKGARWSSEISKELATSNVCILILTRDNLHSDWIMFESGAISRTLDQNRVCPIVFDAELTDISGPLAQFQATRFSEEDMRQLFLTINSTLGDLKLPEQVADSVFKKWWPDLNNDVNAALEAGTDIKPSTEVRSDRDLIEEILLTLRNLTKEPAREVRQAPLPPMRYVDSAYHDLLDAIKAIVSNTILLESEYYAAEKILNDLLIKTNNNRRLSPAFKERIEAEIREILKLLGEQRLGDIDADIPD